jgi:hypothetical protein
MYNPMPEHFESSIQTRRSILFNFLILPVSTTLNGLYIHPVPVADWEGDFINNVLNGLYISGA